MTFSIVAIDDSTGDLGVAVASKFLAVGAVVPWATAGLGAIATQALANVRFGPDGLAALGAGGSAQAVVDALTGADPGAAQRQLGIVDVHGGSASFTGTGCLPWAGGRTGPGFAVQGNILSGPEVADAMVDAFGTAKGPLPDRLLAALLAGDRAGGDRRGRQSAALLVVREGGGYGDADDRWIDLRVDDHADPVPELIRLRGVWRVLMERPDPADLLAIDPTIAAELRGHLARLGWDADSAISGDEEAAFRARIRAELDGVPRIGTPRDGGPTWGPAWDASLIGWMGVANLEARTAAAGWIDPAVLVILRAEASGGPMAADGEVSP
jgi:uncharacterized Ntn-hydrolase superfamily protein